MDNSDLVSTGIVEFERNGMIHRGQYRTDGAVVTVSYGTQVMRKLKMRRHDDEAYTVARRLLRDIVVEVHENI